MTNHDYGLL